MQHFPFNLLILFFTLFFSLRCTNDVQDRTESLNSLLINSIYNAPKMEYGFAASTNIEYDQNRKKLTIYKRNKNCVIKSEANKIDTVEFCLKMAFKFFIKKDSVFYLFSQNLVYICESDTCALLYKIPLSHEFLNSQSSRPIVTKRHIISLIYPVYNPSHENDSEYRKRVKLSPLLSIYDRLLDTQTFEIQYPDEPIFNTPIDKFNMNQYKINYCVDMHTNQLLVSYSMLNRIDMYDLSNYESVKTIRYINPMINDLGQNPADELWEKQDRQKYVATISYNSKIFTHKDFIYIQTIQGMKYRDGFISQLDRKWYLLKLDRNGNLLKMYNVEGHSYNNLTFFNNLLLLHKKDKNESNDKFDIFDLDL